MFKNFILAIILIIPNMSANADTECPSATALNTLFSRSGIYVGELHGTNESPEFFRCLIDVAVAINIKKPIIVSLELPESAKQLDSTFWAGKDGRSSRAMWQLMQALIQYEKENKITLSFQYLDNWPEGSPVGVEEKIALRIKEALAKGFVIAFGGNLHNVRRYPYKTDKKSAGMLLENNLEHLRLGTLEGGQIWGCLGQPIVCGISDISKSSSQSIVANKLYDDPSKIHDYLWYLNKFTASPPFISQ